MKPSNSRVLKEILFAILNANPPVQISPKPGDAEAGDVSFNITLPDPLMARFSRCQRECMSRHIINFLGEWFVRANLLMFEHHVCTNINPNGWGISEHKSFGMKICGKTLEFSFHVSLLHSLTQSPSAAGAPPVQPGTPPSCQANQPGASGVSGAPDTFRQWLAGIPLLRPREMYARLADEGYVGQDAARIAVCLMAYRHVRRLRMIHIDGVPRNALPPKENVLLLGPTGCGKTYLIELLFHRILGLPTLIADMTSFTETGYVGDSVSCLIPRLIQAAGGDARKAAVGIICLDEFDKIASCGSRARFAGQGTTKDVSGYGVQRELLKMLESAQIYEQDGMDSTRTSLSTADIPFIACGAFSGFKAAVRSLRQDPSIGFGAHPDRAVSGRCLTDRVENDEVVPVANFAEYGMLPELMGRFGRIVPLHPMGTQEIVQILNTQVIERYSKELAAEGVQLIIEDTVLEQVAEECLKMETGARGIAASLAAHLEQACFDAYSLPAQANSVIRIKCTGTQVTAELTADGPSNAAGHGALLLART